MTPLPDDAGRASTLRELGKLATPPQPTLDSLTRLLAAQLQCPMVWLGLLDDARLRLKTQLGLALDELPLPAPALLEALMRPEGFAIGDARQASAVDAAWLAHAGPVQAAATACIVVDGHAVGLVCAMDTVPREFSSSHLGALRDMAQVAGTLLESGLKEQRWRLHAERVRVAGLSSSDWLWESDAVGRATWVSSGVESHTGLPASTVIGHTLGELNHRCEADTTDSWQRYKDARAKREPFRDVICDRETLSGTITVSISATPFFDEHGVFCGYRGTNSNITERMQAQIAARRAERLLNDALDSLTAGVMISDLAGKVMLANPVWRRNVGHYMSDGATWPEIVDRMAAAGDYPDVLDRQAFVRWRLSLASSRGELHEMRWKDRWVIASDRLLADGSVVHLSVDITDRKLAELALAESKAQLGAVLDAVPDLWFVLSAEGHYLACSSEDHPMLAHSWESVRGKPFGTGVPAEVTARALPAISRAVNTGELQRIDYALITTDGVLRAFEARISPMPNRQVLYVTRDVTEQSRAADKLRLSEELYRSVASAISDGLLVVTPALTIIAVNPAGCDILGVAQIDVVNQGDNWPFALLGPDEKPIVPEQHPVKRVVSSERPLMNQIHALRRPDGQLRWVSLNAHPLQLRPEGGTFSVVLTFRNITQQRASERALVLAEERWKFALEGSGDGVWDWDATTGKFYYSSRWKEMRGFADNEIGDTADEWRSRVHPEDLPLVLSAIRRHMRGELPLYDIEYRIKHRLGHDVWIRDRGKIVTYGSDGKALRVVGTQSDITRSKQAEQMQRDKQAAELASQAKSEFLSRMSHEMRTPLNAVIGFAQLLGLNQNALEAATVREYAGHVLDAGEHLLALIDDVLDLQKIEEGALSLNLGTVDLHDAIARTMELLWPLAQTQEVRFDNQVAPGAWVHADMQRLRQVLLNVGSNAVKYNHPGGSVRWRIEDAAPGRLMLCVEDSGAGMSDDQMNRLFQPFERLGRETSTIEGTGLGLIIARSLTQAIGGRLHVESVAGRGTCVRVDLSRAETPTHDKPVDSPDEAAAPGLRMLYVEDNRINAILFEEAMRMHASQIDLRVAEDGDQALSLAQDWQPEVLVLDAHLPGISGFEVLRQLRTLPGLDNVPAYMCSADAMPDDVQRAYEAGFIGYWTKPINIGSVLADIEQCVQRARSGVTATDSG